MLPITADVTIRVYDLAAAQNRERIDDVGNLYFQWRSDQDTMTFYDVPDEDIDQINADYNPDFDFLVLESSFNEAVENDLPFSAVSPEISTNIQNMAPANITPNIPIHAIDSIHTSIECQKHVNFKEHENIIHSKERKLEISSDNDHIESVTRVVNE